MKLHILFLIVVSLGVWPVLAQEADCSQLDSASAYIARGKSALLSILALRDYTCAIRLEPDNPEYYWERGRQYNARRDYAEAEADFTRAIQADPAWIQGYVTRAEFYEKRRQFARATEDYTRALNLNPEDGYLYAARGMQYSRLEDWEQTLTDYEMALRYMPHNRPILYELIRANVELGYYLNATWEIPRYFVTEGEMADADNISAYLQYLETQVRKLKKIKCSQPGDDWVLGEYFYSQEEYVNAISALNCAVGENSAKVLFLETRARAYTQMGSISKGLADYRRIVEIEPGNSFIYLKMAKLYYFLALYEPALEAYQKFFRAGGEPTSEVEASRTRAAELERLVAQERYTPLTQLLPPITCNPSQSDKYIVLGADFYRQGRYAEAVQQHTCALEYAPATLAAYEERALALLMLDENELALADGNRLIALEPESFVGYYSRGLAFANLGDYGPALDDLTQALEYGPDHPIVLAHIGDVYYAQAQYPEALEYYHRYMASVGDHVQSTIKERVKELEATVDEANP